MEKKKFKLEKIDDPNLVEVSKEEEIPLYLTEGQGVTVAAFALNDDLSHNAQDFFGNEIDSEQAREEILKAVREEQEKT